VLEHKVQMLIEQKRNHLDLKTTQQSGKWGHNDANRQIRMSTGNSILGSVRDPRRNSIQSSDPVSHYNEKFSAWDRDYETEQ